MANPVEGAVEIAGPYFEDLRVGTMATDAPALTLTDGHAAVHQAILGGRLRLALDAELCHEVTGRERPLAHPALVCDVAIGQSTSLTARVIANLFYRGLAFRRMPTLGDTLSTTTEVVALRQTSARPGRAATGLAALRMRTLDQHGHEVLDFWRCAMLPLRDPAAATGHDDDLGAIAPALDERALLAPVRDWRVDRFRQIVGAAPAAQLRTGTRWAMTAGDVVSCAPELTRLSLNLAAAHHDSARGMGGERLVYGGHTIGLAAAQATQALPGMMTILAWHSCDHVAPVFEGDTLTSELELERLQPIDAAHGGAVAHLRSRVTARRLDGGRADEQVLDWRFVALLA